MHPDRNYGNVEETTKLFAEVQSAYEVLSDAQERSWYDSNRTRILRGDSSRDEMSFEDTVQDISTEDIISTIFLLQDQLKRNDTQISFYATVRRAFETIAHDEDIASLQDGVRYVEYPDFGQKDETDQDLLRQFYIRWGNFSSRKSFSWKEAFRYSEAPDRRVRRMMEKENKRLRDMAVREYNEAVRSLTSFVKKRDIRYKPIIQNDSDRQKALRDAAKAQAMRSRAANTEKLGVPSMTGFAAPVHSEENAEETYGNDDSEEFRVQYECVVCKKSFKSEQQYGAHEKSKKHLRGVQHLRRTLQKESENLDLDGSADEGWMISGTQILESSMVGKHQNSIHGRSSDVPGAQQSVSLISEAFPRLDICRNLSKEQDSGVQDVAHIGAFPTGIQQVSREEDDETKHVDRIRGSIDAAGDIGSEQDSISPTRDSTPPIPGGNDFAQAGLKLGKAKRKRAKKAAQAVAAGSSNEVSNFIM